MQEGTKSDNKTERNGEEIPLLQMRQIINGVQEGRKEGEGWTYERNHSSLTSASFLHYILDLSNPIFHGLAQV